MYNRLLQKRIEKKLHSGKAIILLGPRQVGKTTLLTSMLGNEDFLYLNGDDPSVRKLLENPNTEQIASIIGKHTLVFIDEVQRIDGIGLTMKIITDHFKQVQLVASGSSSFEISDKINEPLTGRKWEYQLFPISWQEFEEKHGYLNAEQQLENRLLYGMYPDVLNHPGEEREVLQNLVSSYLYKDILSFADIRKPEILEKLVQALALQVGNEVNLTELSQLIGIDKNTVSKYIDILEKGYVVFKLGSFSKNVRNEIRTQKKVYFYDNGVRNMVLGNFTPLNLRQDKGALWENFLISERMKYNHYHQTYAKGFFWRTKQQQEVDFVELHDGEICGFEFKWKMKRNTKLPKTFVDTYGAQSKVIDRGNFREFLM